MSKVDFVPSLPRKKIYLAGPDVFLQNAKEQGEMLKKACAEHGFEGLYPLDGDLDLSGNDPKWRKAWKIFVANVALIDACDIVLANMEPFRGPSMDVGTAWEVGYGYAKGKTVVGYTNKMTVYKSRAGEDGMHIEDFDGVDNLMIDCSMRDRGLIFEGHEEALAWLKTNHH